MSQEQRYSGFIIKKNQYNEADEIITLFTKEQGKLRVLAKSVKRPISKLAPVLQPLFWIELTVVGNESLPKVIHAQTKRVFRIIANDPERIALWFVVAELLQKSLPDGQKNELLFDLVSKYLLFLDLPDLGVTELGVSLTAFKIGLLQQIGLAVHGPASGGVPGWFSLQHGGFHAGERYADSQVVPPTVWQLFLRLRQWDGCGRLVIDQPEVEPSARLSELIADFIQYQLEREIKSERFLSSRVV